MCACGMQHCVHAIQNAPIDQRKESNHLIQLFRRILQTLFSCEAPEIFSGSQGVFTPALFSSVESNPWCSLFRKVWTHQSHSGEDQNNRTETSLKRWSWSGSKQTLVRFVCGENMIQPRSEPTAGSSGAFHWISVRCVTARSGVLLRRPPSGNPRLCFESDTGQYGGQLLSGGQGVPVIITWSLVTAVIGLCYKNNNMKCSRLKDLFLWFVLLCQRRLFYFEK